MCASHLRNEVLKHGQEGESLLMTLLKKLKANTRSACFEFDLGDEWA